MKCLLFVCTLLSVAVICYSKEEQANCLKIGVVTTCCETEGCGFVNCTDEDHCEYLDGDWGEDCLLAKNQCKNLMVNQSGDSNTSTIGPQPVLDSNATDTNKTDTTTVSPSLTSINVTDLDTTTVEPVTGSENTTLPEETTTSANTTLLEETTTSAMNSSTTMEANYTSTVTEVIETTTEEILGPTTVSHGTNSPTTENVTGVPVNCPDRKFDVASFIGGMVLMLGILSIVFFGCKFYKSRKEMRYNQF